MWVCFAVLRPGRAGPGRAGQGRAGAVINIENHIFLSGEILVTTSKNDTDIRILIVTGPGTAGPGRATGTAQPDPAPPRRSKPTRFHYAVPRVCDPKHCQLIEHTILKTCGLWLVRCRPHYGEANPHDFLMRSPVCVTLGTVNRSNTKY